MAIDSSKRMEYAQEDLETLKGLRPEEKESVLQTMSVDRKRAMVDLIGTIRQDLVPKTNLDLAIEEAINHMETGELGRMPVAKEQMTLFSDHDINQALMAQFGKNDFSRISNQMFRLDLTDKELETAYQDYAEGAKKIFETGEWAGLKALLLKKGLSEKEANIKTYAIIVHAYLIENPGAGLPPFIESV